jgi:hypothetical protein
MTLQGTVVNGVIVVDEPAKLKEGMRVQVVAPEPGGGEPSLANLLKYAGALKDLPEDFASQHDHYIHGTAKR